ncbi:MAG: hypothetical protein ACE5IY_03395 [bacterium]
MQHKLAFLGLVLVSYVLWGMGAAFAQPEENNHPELDWFSIETEHFFVHFHHGAERTARLTAKIAEEVYEPVTTLYEYEPDGKIHFIIRDHDDYSNGAAFFYDNKVEIWATAMDFDLRGSHNWLRNVVTHEFTHMIQIGSSRKIMRRIPAFYFQAIGYEDDKREDVLHGGPNVIASYPIAMTVMPAWFAEGVAQYQIPGLDYDTWDSHRDMILRTATIENQLLTYGEMGVFGKNSLGNEMAYNHGYAFVTYLANQYGIESLKRISKEMKGLFRLTLDGALKKATGKSAHQLYRDWTDYLRKQYRHQLQDILPNRVEGEIVEHKGLGNFNPVWGPDDTSIAYITTSDNDYLSQTGFVATGPLAKNKRIGKAGARYGVSWSPDGSKLAYASNRARSRGGSRYYDLYVFDLQKEKATRLTRALRAHSPHWSPDGRRLIFIKGHDGSENLAIVDLETKQIANLTHYQNGEQLVHPQWSPDGKFVLYSMYTGNGQDLHLLNLASGESTPLIDDEFDSRDGSFSPDGKTVYFSWDRTGIFNIYSLDLDSRKTQQVTNVIGGAFMPAVNRKGELLFTNFTSEGYKIALLRQPKAIDTSKSRYLTYKNGVTLVSARKEIPASVIEKIRHQNYDDTRVPDYQVKPYTSHYSSLAFLPRAMIDYGTLKLGSYIYSYDVLSKVGFLAGFDVNRRGDYDLFALFEYRKFGPTIFFEGYNQVQNTSFKVDSTALILRQLFNVKEAEDKFKYNLLEFDAGLRFKIGSSNELRTAFILSRYSARAKFRETFGESTLNYKYFVGRDISLKFIHRGLRAHLNSAISPRGRVVEIGYDREFNKFLVDFATDRIVSAEIFENFNYNRVTLDWKEYWGLPIKNHTLSLNLQVGFIDTKVDSFFNFFAGGILGNRGYPFFSIEGRKMVQGRVTYRFPFLRHLDMRFMHLYFDKVYLGAFFDYGNAFNGSLELNEFKSSVGGELRMDAFSFYSFPTRIFVNAAYGLDRFENSKQVYGKEWRFYFGISFGYFD